MTARQFLDLLWAEKPASQMILIWTWPDRKSYWCKDVDEAVARAESLAEFLEHLAALK